MALKTKAVQEHLDDESKHANLLSSPTAIKSGLYKVS